MTKRLEEKKEPGYYNFSDYEERNKNNLVVDDNTRVYVYDHNASAYLKNDIVIKAYSNGNDILYDPRELILLYTNEFEEGCYEKKKLNFKDFKSYIIKNVSSQYRCKVIVSSRNKYIERLLLTEEGMYYLIINSKHPEAKFIKEELLHMIRMSREYQNIKFNELLLNNSYTGLFEPGNKILEHMYLEDDVKEKLTKLINSGHLVIRSALQFPVIKGNVMVNEKIIYYIENLDNVKIHNKLDCYLLANKIFEGLASVLNTSDTTIREKIQNDIYDHVIPIEEIDSKPYIHINEILLYFNRIFKDGKTILSKVLNIIFATPMELIYNKEIKDPIVGMIINSLNNYEDINESYPLNLYLEYKGYIEVQNMTDKEAKDKILENYKTEII